MVIKDKIMNMSKKSKLIIIFVFIFLAIFVSVGLPTIARIKNRVTLTDVIPWDGEVATSYNSGEGTKSDPYIITNGNELAFFSEQLKSGEDYEGVYFELVNDIIINAGQFKYDNNIQYILNNKTYYVKEYTNEYYSDIDLENLVGNLYSFDSFENFKGNFNGNSFTIYGAYITKKDVDKLGLFTDLEGKITDTYFENTFVYGGQTTGGIASNTNNSTIENTLFTGYVIGNKTPNTKNFSIDISNKELTLNNTKLENIVIDYNIPVIGNSITSTNITGNYEIIGCTECQVSINGNVLSGGSFNINLGNTLTNNLVVSTNYEDDLIIRLNGLKYNIIYNYAVSGGLIGISNSTTINNSVNKSYIFGYSLSGGLIGLNNSTLNINRSYNTGNINSNLVSGGLLGGIENNTNVVNINNSYNAGAVTSIVNSGLIAEISNSNSVILNKVFDASSTSNVINKIENANVSVNNSYYITGNTPIINGVINGEIKNTTIDYLKNKDNMVKENYLEFVDIATTLEEKDKVWLYEDNALPILYLDDSLNKSITIHSSKYSWNNYSNELKTYDLIKNITVSIVKENQFATDLNIYYYIHNLETPLSKEELNNVSWIPYTDIITINNEGKYVIYAKVVDGNDNIAYLNTDILSLDLTAPSINITLNNKIFNTYKSNLDYVYINDYESLSVIVTDNKDTELDSYYYISDSIKTIEELNNLEDSSWIKYTDKIALSNYGTYVIYVKSVDNSKNINYVNTDYIVYGGYNHTDVYPGKNKVSFNDYVGNISDKSIITLNYEYQNVAKSKDGYTHNLISNILLPLNTKITLIDNNTKKMYSYKVDTIEDIYNYNNSCIEEGCTKLATYPFSLFKELGTSNEVYFDETVYQNNIVKEDYEIIIDLSNTTIVNNYLDVLLYLEVRDNLNTKLMSTLTSTMKKFNIIVGTNTSIELASDNLPSINLNSDSSTKFNLDTKVINKYFNEEKVIDSILEKKKLGLGIYITDELGNIVSKENYNNMTFSIDGNKYTPEENNIIYINLSDIVTNISKTLVIDTKATTLNLNNGNYFIKMFNYTSNFNKYVDGLKSNELIIPLKAEGVIKIEEHAFNVMLDKQIVDKKDNNHINFNIIQSGNYTNPSIRVSLYKKNELTPYNQNYTLVNIRDYVNNDLELIANNIYYAFKTPKKYNGTEETYNNLVLNFKENIENNGYKVVFELYDNDIKISQIEKKFIVK